MQEELDSSNKCQTTHFYQKRDLFAYELLYRGADLLSLAHVGGNRATSSLITSSFLTEGLEKISGNKPCFVNFTEDLLLLGNIVENFPNDKFVVEILEDVQPSKEVIDACWDLKKLGYTLALDDFVFDKELSPLVEVADIIKFDFRLSPVEQIIESLDALSKYNVDFLAEKVETYEEFKEGQKLGFSYFQGYFFAKPEVMKIKELTTSPLTLLNLLSEINKKSISPKKMTEIISTDVSLSYRLLRFINSAYFSLIKEIQSIAQAVTYLGENKIKSFATLAIISEISSKKPAELVRLAAVRAKFCEKLGQASSIKTNSNELFMLGLFSLFHAMLDAPITDILSKLPVSNDIKQALTDQSGPLSVFLETVIVYERGNTKECFNGLKTIRVPEDSLYSIYISSLEFADVFVSL
ncbi:MAG: HDOD domain-containing protein [Desulforhopalus sp.]